MTCCTPWRVRLGLLILLGSLPGLAFVHARPPAGAPPNAERPPSTEEVAALVAKEVEPRSKFAWTSDEALERLAVHPNDPYLQYVALQTGRRERRLEAAGKRVEEVVFSPNNPRASRRDQVDLFSIFTGALAVQESLQLDTMRGQTRTTPEQQARHKEIVTVAALKGPTIKSHPWEKMLGDKKPDIDPLAKMVPEDNFYVAFRSLSKMLDLVDTGDLWAAHYTHQGAQDARSQEIGPRLQKQLVIETNRLLRPVYDGVVEEVGLTGSDLFFGEGSDVTLIFRVKQMEAFRPRMDGFLNDAVKNRTDVQKTKGEILGVEYVHLTTPERDIHVFSAYPEANLHVRSNSKIGLQRVLEAIKGKSVDGKAVVRLGDTKEFAYIRTLMPRGAKEEDGFIYLSDAFIRRLVGPQVKLTERRRMLCYNHVRMLGHASLMFRTEHGRTPKSLEELQMAECLPGAFNKGELICPDGGKYTLSVDGRKGVCSHHGHADNLVPCCETPLTQVAGDEADEYDAFLKGYNSYWRTFFDPIGIRVQVTPKQYRLETIVLPLIDNSIYMNLAGTLGGKPEALDALPVPKRTIFSAAGRFNKEELLKSELARQSKDLPSRLAQELGLPEKEALGLDLYRFIDKGLGNQVGLHVYDAAPTFDLDVAQLLGWAVGNFNGNIGQRGGEEIWISFLVASLSSPVYVSLTVEDAKIVDDFLDRLDKPLAALARRRDNRGGWFNFEEDYYKAKLGPDATMRGFSFSLGPVKWRFFWARIGNGLYIASKSFILEDLYALHKEYEANPEKKPAAGAPGHAQVQLRPSNWNQVLPDYRLSWAENNRKACLNNLGPLSSVGRAMLAEAEQDPRKWTPEELGKATNKLADEYHAVRFYCPEGGSYLLDPKTRSCSCSVHGTADNPHQLLAPRAGTPTAKAMQEVSGVTATLTFLEDGLHAVFVLERK